MKIEMKLLQQRPKRSEREKKEQILDALQLRRRYLINIAKYIAANLARVNGTVTSPEVLKILVGQIGEDGLKGISPKFMGVVFRSGWIRVGYAPLGSHYRPVSVWKKAE